MKQIALHKIKELRKKLSITINEAKELINENNGDLLVCEQEYHKNNINTICRLTECDEVSAKRYYKISNFDVEKTIKKAYEQLLYITATPDEKPDKIGYILWAENDNINKYLTFRDKDLFIQAKDFEYVIDVFKSVFPLKNVKNNSIQNCFSNTSSNVFDNKTSRIIVNRMAKLKTKNVNVESFLRDLIKWFHIQLRYADTIIVDGNL